MTTAIAGRTTEGPRRAAVGLAPLGRVLLRLLPVASAWGVLVVGRAVCLVAQHIPPLVWLVRAVYRWKDARRAAE